jgi:hypothetical protein
MSDDGWLMNNDCGRTQSWPNLRRRPGICLEELRKISVRTVGITAKIWIEHLWNTSYKCYTGVNFFGWLNRWILQLHNTSQSLTHSLTHSIKCNPSWEASGCSATQEIPIILWSLKVNCFVHIFTRTYHQSLYLARWIKSTPSHPISLRSHLLLSLLKGLFPTKTLHSPLSHMYYMLCPSLPASFDHCNNIW